MLYSLDYLLFVHTGLLLYSTYRLYIVKIIYISILFYFNWTRDILDSKWAVKDNTHKKYLIEKVGNQF